jgi:hypothetical protein
MCYERRRAEACVDESAHHAHPGRGVCVCLLLQYLIQSCARGGRRIVEDMCYEIRRAEACVDESAHHAHPGRGVCVCLLLQYLIQSCARGGRRIVEDMCYGAVCVYYCRT